MGKGGRSAVSGPVDELRPDTPQTPPEKPRDRVKGVSMGAKPPPMPKKAHVKKEVKKDGSRSQKPDGGMTRLTPSPPGASR